MANDREVLKEVWEGKIPIKFVIDEADRSHLLAEKYPYNILVSRMTYLPLLPVGRHYNSAVPTEVNGQPTEMWYSYRGIPLKWHLPVGVLFDLVGDGSLPWQLDIHISEFPADKIQRLGTNVEEEVKTSFIHNVKEAGWIKHRGLVTSALRPEQFNQLWRGLHRDKFDDFWMINHRLMEHIDNTPYRFIPFRIYIDMHQRFIQKSFKPMTEDGKLTTLGQLLSCFYPEAVIEEEPTEQESPDILKSYSATDNICVKIQGIEAPFNTPIQWLSEHLSHADNFLYIIIQQRKQKS